MGRRRPSREDASSRTSLSRQLRRQALDPRAAGLVHMRRVRALARYDHCAVVFLRLARAAVRQSAYFGGRLAKLHYGLEHFARWIATQAA